MKYRPLGNTGQKISTLSLGCMRFPDEETAVAIVQRSLDLGINYFETSVGYGGGNSEQWLGKALAQSGRRQDVMVSTKSSPSAKDARSPGEGLVEALELSLQRLGLEYVDFYHGWSVSSEAAYEMCVQTDWLEELHKARDAGKVRHIGITSHGTPALVERIIDDGHFQVLTVQYSLILQSYRNVIAKAHAAGMGVVLMGPLAGGLLAGPSPVLEKVFAPDDQVTGALKYVLSDPGVSSAASGMTSVADVDANCAIIDALPDDLTIDYQAAVNETLRAELGDRLEEFEQLLCGGCRYCLNVCPEKIGPHNLFKAYNAAMLGAPVPNREKLVAGARKLRDKCTLCGLCVDACPQKINVPEHLDRIAEYFSSNRK